VDQLQLEPTLLRACEIWANAADGGWTMRAEGLHAFGCEAGQRAFNQAFITAPRIDAAALGAMITPYEHGKFRLRLRDELHESSLPAIEANSLVRHGGIPTMTMPLTSDLSSPETSLRIERVSDAKSLSDHVRVVAAGFHWQGDTLGRVFTPRLLDEPDFAAWVGYENDEPVASSQMVVHSSVAGLYYIATMESARRKGYGEAMTRAAMLGGISRGCDTVCLQASSLGRLVYERIGFRAIGEYITYVPDDA
jgi:hypothetical protein